MSLLTVSHKKAKTTEQAIVEKRCSCNKKITSKVRLEKQWQLPGQSQYFDAFYLLHKFHKTSYYRTAAHITIKEKFVYFRVKNRDTYVLKKLLQQQNTITKERQSHSTSGNTTKELFNGAFCFSSPNFCPHAYQPQPDVQERKRNHRVLITATPAFLGAYKIIL